MSPKQQFSNINMISPNVAKFTIYFPAWQNITFADKGGGVVKYF